MPGYEFYYNLPIDSKVGGVGIFVRNCYSVQELNHFNIASSDNCKVENLWLQVSSSSKKYIVAGIYRHPNQNISEFKCKLESELQKLSVQSTPCIIAGDINIDLLKFEVHSGTAEFVDTLLINNFSPIITMPTRITSRSSTLIDHIYFYPGTKYPWCDSNIKSGNILSDITDHLPNFIFILNNSKKQRESPTCAYHF